MNKKTNEHKSLQDAANDCFHFLFDKCDEIEGDPEDTFSRVLLGMIAGIIVDGAESKQKIADATIEFQMSLQEFVNRAIEQKYDVDYPTTNKTI